MSDWQWADTWGWDYPLVAMTAARVGEPEIAIDALLMDTPKNRYHPNGHNYQRPGLTIYLPGNGGLLSADGDDGGRLGRRTDDATRQVSRAQDGPCAPSGFADLP